MNSIKLALNAAGLRLPPLNKRVWLWLHDHPGKSSGEIAKAIDAAHNNVATVLTDMKLRGMVESAPGTPNGRGRPVMVWKTNGLTFEHKPKQRDAKKPAFWKPEMSEPQPALVVVNPPTPKLDIDTLTVKDARKLFDQLRELFTV